MRGPSLLSLRSGTDRSAAPLARSAPLSVGAVALWLVVGSWSGVSSGWSRQEPATDDRAALDSARERTHERLEADDPAAALESARRWASLADRLGDRRELVLARSRTAAALTRLSRDREAAELDELAVRDLPGAGLGARDEILVYQRAAVGVARMSRIARARELLGRARALAEGVDDPLVEASLLVAEGLVENQIGNESAAYRLREGAVRIYEEHGDAGSLANALYDLGHSAIALHAYAAGVAQLRRAIQLGLEERVERYTRISIAIAHYELNQLEEAEEIFREVLAEAKARGDEGSEAWTSGELALIYKQRGENEEALAWCDRAISLSREQGDVRNLVAWLSNKGVVLRNMGRHREALEVYRETREADQGVGTVFLARSLAKLEGQSWAALGEDDAAERSLRKAARLSKEAEDFKLLGESELELARLHRSRGEPETALVSFLTALDTIERMRGTLQLESFKRDFFSNKVGVYAETLDLLTEGSFEDGLERSFEVAERARARAFLDTLAESRAELEQTLPAEYRERELELLDEISELQAGVRRGDDTVRVDAEAESERLRGELETLELEVRERFPRFREMRSTTPASLEQVRRELHDGEVMLAYFLSDPASHLWVVEEEGVRHWRLEGATRLGARVRAAFGDLSRPGTRPTLEPLADTLLGPWLAERAGEPSSIVLVASGALHFVPFEALPIDVDGRTLGDLAPTSYAPSATTWVELRRRPVEIQEPMLLALGDAVTAPGVDRLRAVADLEALETLGALPHSRAEVERVASVFGRGASTILLGEEATETRLTASAPGHSVVHLATHGWIDPATPSASGLVVGADAAAGDDGILQLREIVRLDLAADLVALSACESALGELVTGEGMVGLARSFFYAGADTVLATLWSVDDATSARFMEAFYRALRRGVSKAEALRRARAEIRSQTETAHPYYWAPYVLLGRGDDGVAMPARGLPGWGIAASLLLGLGLAVWVTARRR